MIPSGPGADWFVVECRTDSSSSEVMSELRGESSGSVVSLTAELIFLVIWAM